MKCILGVTGLIYGFWFTLYSLDFARSLKTTLAAVPGYEASTIRARHVQKVLVACTHAQVDWQASFSLHSVNKGSIKAAVTENSFI